MADVSQSEQISDEELEDISPVVSNAMFVSVTSQIKARAQKNHILTLEFLFFVRNGRLLERYLGGSTAEGTALSDSDTDKMLVFSNIQVTCKTDNLTCTQHIVFGIDTSKCQPGYTRLVPLSLNPNLKTLYDDHGKSITDMLEQHPDGRVYLSSEKIVRFWVNFLSKRNPSALIPEYRHGPAATTVNEDRSGYMKKKLGERLEQDFVQGLPLDTWPPSADDWENRQRKYEWPSKDLVSKVMNMKCHVVAVGDKLSVSSSIEWRLSYLLPERELVWSLNDVQLQCYVLLKKFLKIFIAPIGNDDISSYHMKTIVFWETENNPGEFWQPCYLLKRFKDCLLFFKACIKKRCIEHYIDRRNLLNGKLEDSIVKEQIIKCVDVVLNNLVQTALECADVGNYSLYWIDSKKNIEKFLDLCIKREDPCVTYDFVKLKPSFQIFHLQQTVFGIQVELVLADFKTLAVYHEAYTSGKVHRDIEDFFNESVLKLINLRIAITLLKNPIRNVDSKTKVEKLQKLLEDNVEIDALSGNLYLATFLLKLQRIDEVRVIIQKMLHKESKLFYAGHCSTFINIDISNGRVSQRRGLLSPFKSPSGQALVAFDVTFSKDDEPFVPYALKYECLMDRACLFHPVVYMMYVNFICCEDSTSSLKALMDLEKFVVECDESSHNFKQINILGHCFFLKGHYKKAFDCFSKSLTQTISTNRSNSAIFHLIIMIYHLQCESIYKR